LVLIRWGLKYNEKQMKICMNELELTNLGFTLIFAGIIITILGIFLVFFGSLKSQNMRSEVRGGGVVLIGPFPIIFGTDKQSAIFAAVLGLIILLLFIFFYFAHSGLKFW